MDRGNRSRTQNWIEQSTAADLFVDTSGFRLEWVGPDRFELAKAYFRKHADHDYSFIDCTSFVVMRELRLRDALTTDRHFGFLPSRNVSRSADESSEKA